MSYTRLSLLNISVDDFTLDELLDKMNMFVFEKKKGVIAYVNIHAFNIAYRDFEFRSFLDRSEVVFCDGVGIRLGALLARKSIKNRYTSPDFIEKIAKTAENLSWRIFFLGAKPGIAKMGADKLKENSPRLQIEAHHGYFDKEYGSDENTNLIKRINDFRPHVLVVGFGMPLQEKWIVENFEDLDVNIFFPAGALFDYVAGHVKRAPRWMTDNGFEWLGRLLIEPRRLWKRYIVGNPLFFWRVFVHHILKVPLPY